VECSIATRRITVTYVASSYILVYWIPDTDHVVSLEAGAVHFVTQIVRDNWDLNSLQCHGQCTATYARQRYASENRMINVYSV